MPTHRLHHFVEVISSLLLLQIVETSPYYISQGPFQQSIGNPSHLLASSAV
jgi:hypothetical protein